MSKESSIDIDEDRDDLDENEELMLQNIETNPQAHLPTFIEVSDMKRPMSVTTTYQRPKANSAEEGLLVGRKLKAASGFASVHTATPELTINFINRSFSLVTVYWCDPKQEKTKIFEIEANSNKRHPSHIGHQFMVESGNQLIAAYKSPLNFDKLNSGTKNLEIGIVIDENLDVTTKNIEDVLSLESRIAMQKIRHVNNVTKLTHEDTVEKKNLNTLSVWGKTGNAGNFASANHGNGIRPFSAVLRNDTLNN